MVAKCGLVLNHKISETKFRCLILSHITINLKQWIQVTQHRGNSLCYLLIQFWRQNYTGFLSEIGRSWHTNVAQILEVCICICGESELFLHSKTFTICNHSCFIKGWFQILTGNVSGQTEDHMFFAGFRTAGYKRN